MKEKNNRNLFAGKTEGLSVKEDINSLQLLNRCVATVFKEYLPHIAQEYTTKEYGEQSQKETSPTESVASFDITKIVMEKDDKIIEKLKNVYHLLAASDNSIALIINRKYQNVRLTVAVGIRNQNSEEVINLAKSVRDALLGNFPGSECTNVVSYSSQNNGAFAPLNENINFNDFNFSSLGIITNIASDFNDSFSEQSIEKLIDGVQVEKGQEYTLLLIGQSMPNNQLERNKDDIYQMYTAMSPYAKRTRNWGKNESESWNESISAGIQHNFGAFGTGFSANASAGHSWGKGISLMEGESAEFTQYAISHTLSILDQKMKRFDQCEALGLWQFAGYVFSKNLTLVNEVSHMFMSLTSGKESYYEKPSINIWNANGTDPNVRNEILKIRKYVSRLQHPVFEKKSGNFKYINEANWPEEVNCTSDISGPELSRALNIPRKSVPGVAVIECAPFGREVTSYDSTLEGDVSIGHIHHMHHDEDMIVRLAGSSLTSHVFITGSTGAGKSNTVYTLLKNARTNYLVIEPTKGEYKYAFRDAHVFGTNYRSGQILKINPFAFPDDIHVYEHIDRLLEVFNVCWPMYAAMPAVLKDAIIRAYEKVGWNTDSSINLSGRLFPTFADVCEEIDNVITSSDYSDENKGNYRGSLKTRLNSLTNGINGLIFCQDSLPNEVLFDSKCIVDLSRIGSAETKSLIMGILVISLQEYRMSQRNGEANEGLKHLTVLEEAHHLLRAVSASGNPEIGGGIGAKSVEMLANAIAEMRTYGEGFVIVDQAPGLLDMSVIRNTNTKIIMRLPDQSDRELVGKSANLRDDQIQELAKLQKGVAAIYQNEWVEPVLCHIDKFVPKEPINNNTSENCISSNRPILTEEEKKYLNTCVYDINYIVKKSDINYIDCVEKLEADGYLKHLLFEYGRNPGSRRTLYPEIVYRYFNIEQLCKDYDYKTDLDGFIEYVVSNLTENYQFMEGTSLQRNNQKKWIFFQTILVDEIERRASIRSEVNERVSLKLSDYLHEIKGRYSF